MSVRRAGTLRTGPPPQGQSKTATILFTVAMAKKWAADGITANALHPGVIMTNLQRHLDEAQLRFVGVVDEQGRRPDVSPGWKTPPQGAATSVLLAASPHVHGVTGRYFEDCNEAVVGMTGVDEVVCATPTWTSS
jgi:NAD(P)-dependent dehydrogenase (short-subunit alcohol dehydrogenase family)